MKNIIILGAGLAGEITALAFASNGIKTTILEKTSLSFPKDIRTTALTNFSKKFLSTIGIWKELKKHIANIKDVYVVDDFSPRMIHLSDQRDEYEALGYMIENGNFRNVIHNLAMSNELIEVKTSVDYKLEDGTITIGDNKTKPDLVIISDGRNSEARRNHFTDRFSKSYNQSAIIFNIKHEKPHDNTAIEHFMPRGPFAILPLVNPYESGIVWTESPEVAAIYKEMPKKELTEYLKERVGEFLGNIEISSDVSTYPLIARITKNYYKDNMVLIADSAHIVHPLAGQGLNQGIKDIESLVSIISRNLSVGLKIDSSSLAEYERSRTLDNYSMYLITDNLNRIFSNKIPIISELRKIGLSLIDKFPTLKKRLAL
ncbi:MAG: FAD-dependent monooxygenase [Rickettsiaceae bacterium]|nr:FAD-dependent monooxygenase [Rickettsiaceae bacterium]